LVHFAC